MAPRQSFRLGFAAIAAALVLIAAGCSQHPPTIPLFYNAPPTIEFTAAPVSSADTAYYVYEMHWSAYDPDGRVDHYDYAIDPRGGVAPETVWVTTRRSGETIHFAVRQADSTSGAVVAAPHTFVVRAVDDRGARSALVSRSFFSYTMAPLAWITSPVGPAIPEWQFDVVVGPDLRVTWQGHDPDAIGHGSPVRYRWHLASSDDPVWSEIDPFRDPAEMRRRYAATNFATWDSTAHDSTFVELRGLTPGRTYLFIVVAVDEVGAYTADWSTQTNILPFRVAERSTVAPRIVISTEGLQYAWPSGGTDPFDEQGWVKVEAPAGAPLAYRWFAEPAGNYRVADYRWMLDGDIPDETPRTNEATDTRHWSAWNLATTGATIGPFAPGGVHFLYVQARDDHGNTTTGVVQLRTVAMTLDRELLVVDDTRREVDRYVGSSRLSYTNAWPAAAELDTFLYAVGGVPWRGAATGRAGASPPGLFAGYSFDTAGTRSGAMLMTADFPLSKLARYRHVMWLTDDLAKRASGSPADVVNATSMMRWMCAPGRQNVLASYLRAGGEAWVAGGGAGYAATIEFNASGAFSNDVIYGDGRTVFSNASRELVEGRFMYDFARWRSEFVCATSLTVPTRSPRAVGDWSHAGWGGRIVRSPDYTYLPPTLRRRSDALGDTLPVTRANTPAQRALYFTSGAFEIEYLTRPNAIAEDCDPDPALVDQRTVLDSLYEFVGGSLATSVTGSTPVAMTYYHGVEAPQFVFTGFSLWEWTRADCQGLVDFVLQRIWGMAKSGGSPAHGGAATARAESRPVSLPTRR